MACALAVFCPNWIGDVVMATPAIRSLREHFPAHRLIAVMKPYVAGVLEGSPWIDEVLLHDPRGPSSRRMRAVAAALRRHRPELAVLFPNTFRSALTAFLGGCRRRVGYVRYGRGWLLTDRLYARLDSSGRRVPSPVIDDYSALAEVVGCPPGSRRMELFATESDQRAASEVWETAGFDPARPVVCLNPGAAFGAAKHWPPGYFVELARQLVDTQGCSVLVLCGPKERQLADYIAATADRPGVCSLGRFPLSVGLTKGCIRRCDLLITTDSGPRHFATAFDRPTLTLFGPTHIGWTETYHDRAVHLQRAVPCGPCQRRICPLGHHRCMNELTPAQVLVAALRLLPAPALRLGRTG